MAQKKVGELIKEARTKKGLSQEKLAGMVEGLSASELSKAERGEKDLAAEELKAIAKICGVTQKSLLEAAGLTTAAKTSSSSAKKTSTTAAKKTSTSAAKKTSTAAGGEKLTATEKKFLELYRAASSATRKDAEAVLKGTKKVQEEEGLVGSLLGGALEALTGLGKK